MFSGLSYACCGCGKQDWTHLYRCRACNFALSPKCAPKLMLKYEIVVMSGSDTAHILSESHKDEAHSHGTWQRTMVLFALCARNTVHARKTATNSASKARTLSYANPVPTNFCRQPKHPFLSMTYYTLIAKDFKVDCEWIDCSRTDNALTYCCHTCHVEMHPCCALATRESVVLQGLI